jgi:hypothetical protein
VEHIILLPLATVVGGIALLVLIIWQRGRLRELAVRERIALIERGLVPSPESDPARFEALLGRPPLPGRGGDAAIRYRTGGVLIIGLGAALMLIIGVAGESPTAALGVGGAFVAIGCALIINSFLTGPPPTQLPPPSSPATAFPARQAAQSADAQPGGPPP